jgi:hypothetical protein
MQIIRKILARRGAQVGSFLAALTVAYAVIACDVNVGSYLVKDNSQSARIERARVHLDNGESEKAEALLQPMIEDPKQDSNDVRIMLAAAKLGKVELGVWDIFSKLISSSSAKVANPSDLFTTALSSVLGTGADREAKIEALLDTILMLKDAPDKNSTTALNTACVLGGLVAIPVGTDMTTAMDGIVTGLKTVAASVSAGSCETGPLDSGLAGVDRAIDVFNTLKTLVSQCPFFKDSTQVNAVTTLLDNLTTVADKGCAAPTCTIQIAGLSCDDLFPTCVRDVLSSSTTDTVAGDGKVSRCEMFMHCLNPLDCFKMGS